MTGRHHALRPLAHREVRAQLHAPDRPAFRGHFEHQRRARVIVPHLDRIDTMPARALAACHQEIDRRRGGAAVLDARIAERFAKLPAFRMRFEIEQADDLGGRESAHQLFFRHL